MTKSIKPMLRIHNSETDEIIDREMNDIEFAQYQSKQLENAAIKVEAQTKANAKATLLEKLGITEDEAKLLLG